MNFHSKSFRSVSRSFVFFLAGLLIFTTSPAKAGDATDSNGDHAGSRTDGGSPTKSVPAADSELQRYHPPAVPTNSGSTSASTSGFKDASTEKLFQCVKTGIEKYTETAGAKDTPSEKWVAFLASGVAMYTAGKNGDHLNTYRTPEDEVMMKAKVIRAIQSFGYCSEGKMKPLSSKDKLNARNDYELKFGNPERSEKAWVTNFVSGQYENDKAYKRNAYVRSMQDIFGVNEAGYSQLFSQSWNDKSSDQLKSLYFDDFLKQSLATAAPSNDYLGNSDGSSNSKTYINKSSNNFNEMKSCLTQIQDRQKKYDDFKPGNFRNNKLCQAMADSCDLKNIQVCKVNAGSGSSSSGSDGSSSKSSPPAVDPFATISEQRGSTGGSSDSNGSGNSDVADLRPPVKMDYKGSGGHAGEKSGTKPSPSQSGSTK